MVEGEKIKIRRANHTLKQYNNNHGERERGEK